MQAQFAQHNIELADDTMNHVRVSDTGHSVVRQQTAAASAGT